METSSCRVSEAMRRLTAKNRRDFFGLLQQTQGVVFVEYVGLLVLVTVIGAVAVFGLGLPLLKLYRFAQMVLALPIP